jgi:two-component system, OmpR family, sensor histidine kinase VicK
LIPFGVVGYRLKKEIEEELRPGFTERISDPYEIEKIAFDLVKSAKEEVMVLFSTVNACKRQERAGLISLLQETNLIRNSQDLDACCTAIRKNNKR